MIRGPDVSQGHRRSAEIPVWIKQLEEHRPGRRVPLQVESTNTAGTIVEIEIGVELFIFRLELVVRWTGLALRRADFSPEVGRHVRVRTQCSLLLSAPQADADGAPGLQLQGLQEADNLQRRGCADG